MPELSREPRAGRLGDSTPLVKHRRTGAQPDPGVGGALPHPPPLRSRNAGSGENVDPGAGSSSAPIGVGPCQRFALARNLRPGQRVGESWRAKVATCNAGHGCKINCSQSACACIFIAGEGCTCWCGAEPPKDIPGLTLDSVVSLSVNGLTVSDMAKVLNKVLPGQVGIPLSGFKPDRKLRVKVQDATFRDALRQAGFWTRDDGDG
jgi:hypothetical protein